MSERSWRSAMSEGLTKDEMVSLSRIPRTYSFDGVRSRFSAPEARIDVYVGYTPTNKFRRVRVLVSRFQQNPESIPQYSIEACVEHALSEPVNIGYVTEEGDGPLQQEYARIERHTPKVVAINTELSVAEAYALARSYLPASKTPGGKQ